MVNTPNKGPCKPAPARFGKGQPSHYCGRKGRSGAPKGNTNAVRHGMVGSKLPEGCRYIEHRVNALRRNMEQALLELRGEINIVDAATINSILKWEKHGLLASHWLRHQIDTLSALERLKFSEAIAKASDARDRNIRALGLDVKPDPWAELDALPAVASDVPEDNTTERGNDDG